MTGHVYILVRQDIPLEHQITQACHAALEMGLDLDRVQTAPWHLVTLAVPDERVLCEWHGKLSRAGIPARLFYEPDALDGITPSAGFTALATAPVTGQRRKHLARLPLWTAGNVSDGG